MNVKTCVVKAKHKRAPVDGSVKGGTGTCPECLTPNVKISKGGFIGAHSVATDVDPTLPVVATGSPKGDPRDATVRRAVEARRVAAGSIPMPSAPSAPEGRDEAETRAPMSPGPAIVRGRSMRPMATDVVKRQVGAPAPAPAPPVDNRRGWSGSAGTMAGSTGRERMDREASTVPMVGAAKYGAYAYLTHAEYDGLSRSQQRKYWERIKRQAAYAERRKAVARASVPVRLGTGAVGGRSFAEGDSCETERLMQQPRS